MENLPAVKQTFGITPKGIEEAIRLAKIMAASGLMPKALNSPEAVFVAMQMGAEIGLSPMASVQNIAVINGRPGIYGDAALAVVRASGLLEEFKEWQDGERKTPKWTFYCRIKRKGYEATTGTYSWAEACEAGLDRTDPASPWKKWTARMMQFKARNFAMRDQFADILKGIRTSEENYDAIDMDLQDSGVYHSTSEPKDSTVSETLEKAAFEISVDDKYSDSVKVYLSEFVTESAAFYKTTEESIKTRAMDNWDGFCKAFEAWREKKYPTTTSPQETPENPKAQPASDAGHIAEEKPAESPAPPADPWQEKRSRYINLKGPGYSTFVFQNKSMFAEMPVEQRMEAIEKWVKLYPGQPWPLNADVEQKVELEKAPDQPHERPISFTDEYKALMDLKTQRPDVYAKVRVELNIAPDTVLHCVTLKAAMEDVIRAMPGQDEPPVETYQPPAVSDTSGF